MGLRAGKTTGFSAESGVKVSGGGLGSVVVAALGLGFWLRVGRAVVVISMGGPYPLQELERLRNCEIAAAGGPWPPGGRRSFAQDTSASGRGLSLKVERQDVSAWGFATLAQVQYLASGPPAPQIPLGCGRQ